ncbi:jg11418 [Pararge aegeria aegeria]|uniref:Jg11418 protein n=1 Tax=Pararge aegeria aegeria TaxID=348720 RepID=A0A8S4QG85_9NEOP|nr:jg11418 [Pararge aegeria aegeria]
MCVAFILNYVEHRWSMVRLGTISITGTAYLIQSNPSGANEDVEAQRKRSLEAEMKASTYLGTRLRLQLGIGLDVKKCSRPYAQQVVEGLKEEEEEEANPVLKDR